MAIDPFYWLAFAAFALPAAWLEYDHGSGLFGGGKGAADAAVAAAAGGGSVEYARFRNNYLAVFALMMGELPRLRGSQHSALRHAPRMPSCA